MFFKNDSNEKWKQLQEQNEELNQEIDTFFQELGISSEEFSQLFENKENFSEEEWELIQAQKKEQEENLARDLDNIANPKKTSKAFKHMRDASRWLAV